MEGDEEGDEDTTGNAPDVAVVPTADDIDLSDATPRIVTSACGALPVLDTPVSTALAAPATLVEGQVVRGRIDPDVSGNEAHYWRVELQPGYHHLIVDSRRLDGRTSNIGLEIDEVDAAGDSDEQLMRASEIDFRARSVEFFVSSEARTVTLQVAPRFAGEDYLMGVFANGRAIPSPFFEDCPDIAPLAVGTTQALGLNELQSANDYAWYELDLVRGRYAFDGLASRVDGRDSNIIYSATTFDGFGGAETEDELFRISEVGTVSTDRATFARSAAGPVWLRLQARAADLDLQFTVSPDVD